MGVYTNGMEQEQIELLIQSAIDGNQEAFAELYQGLIGQIYRLAYGVLLHKEDAEEVVQDSFAYAFRNIERYDSSKSAFKTWLYTITMSRCRNKRRRKILPTINITELADLLPAKGATPEHHAARSAGRDIIIDGLRQLSPKLREAVVLRYFDGLTYREMAEVLGCPQKTAESRVRLAHKALRDILSNQKDALASMLSFNRV